MNIVEITIGSTVVYAVERLAQRVEEEKLSIVCVPSSFQAQQLVIQNNLVLGDLARYPELDVAIDGADEVDSELNCIKGGGGCQLQEKIVISNAKQFVIIADYRKDSTHLGEKWKKGVPIEVTPMAYVPIMMKLKAMAGTPVLRMAQNKAGPVVTDNGNFILDTEFGRIQQPQQLEEKLLKIPGIVEVGLFCRLACQAYFGQEDGSVVTRKSV